MMKIYYYYLRDPVNMKHEQPNGMKKDKPLGFPRVSVCFGVRSNGDIARGISICSLVEKVDKISKKKGREKAKGMMLKALKSKKSSEPITRWEAFDNMSYIYGGYSAYDFIDPLSMDDFFLCRSNFQPKLTNFEKKLIEGKRKEE